MAQFNLELCSCVVILALFLPLASGACVDFDLGMGSGTIPNSDITASSEQSASTPAINGRLNYTSGSSWCARTSDTNPYLQIDLQAIYIICAVSTQGNSHADQWVRNYTLQFSTNGITWTDYEESGKSKFLIGNDDRNSEKKHVVYGVLAKQLRFRPRTHQAGVCMRTEVFGVKKNPTCEMEAIGLASGGTIPDSSFSASSHFNNKYLPSYGRLNENKRGWAPKTNSNPSDYLQIDLLYEYVICAVATQGANGINEWTENYEIQLSVDGTTMVTYQENNENRVFLGNSNRNSIVINSLQEFESAKFIRFKPTAYNNFKALRVEVYGILLTKVPSQPPAAFKLTASSSTSITASWQLPPVFARHGRNITGFKLFYKKKGSGGSATTLTISKGSTLSRNVIGLDKFTEYGFQVLAYTLDGDGPKSPVEVKRTKEDAPSAPVSLSSVDVSPTKSHGPRITLTWIEPAEPNGVIRSYSLFYSYNGSAAREFSGIDKDTFSHTVDVFGGLTYQFNVTAVTIKPGPYETITVTTRTYAPRAPVPHSVTDVEVSVTAVDILLWPVEQINGPISAYQAIVLKVVNDVEELPENYDSQLKAASDAKNDDVNFYIAAETGNVPALKGPWKFTVGDGEKTGNYLNKELEKGQNYIVYERALTKTTKEVLKGEVGSVAKISITPAITGGREEKSSGFNVVAVAVPAVLLLLLIPAVVVAVLLYRRRRETRSQSASERPVQFDDLQNGYENLGASTSSLVYQNVGDSRLSIEGIEQQSDGGEEEATYSEADDGEPKPIPVANFEKYFKRGSENGAIVLREEYKNLQGDMLFPCEIGKSNRGKNRYGNIVSYDHSRVVLEEIEGDKNSSYINASYIPTYDEVTMTYIATQGPTSTTVDDFWRLVWQENCSTIVMLTNLVEGEKGKCDQYWPDHTSKYGAFTVTLQKTETFADYVIRPLIVTKDSEKRNVHQFHYVTWPDKGVPQHSTALVGFRQKIHARHQATGGPLLVHCSAGVGRTGAYIAIDAMLESAEKIKTVFIQNYVQVMRRSRPYMVQKAEQYVFLHQAVMEALVCGNTEIIPQDLRIVMNKLSMVHKPSKKTGYEREFKRLELVTNAQASQEEAKEAFLPENAVKNRFPNTVPLDNARVHLQASSQEESYINASYVDDYRERNAYILTQAPLENTIKDFWLMISLYNIGTVVMLSNLKEGRQSYPKYWPSEGSARYGVVTVQLLSQETSNNITTRRFTLENAASHDRKSTIQHIQYTGWADGNSCPDPKEILELMNAVQQSQQQSGNGVIVFQCSDGIGRSGCVATIISVIERVKIEQKVDVFQTVKLVRAKRPGAVNTLEQYMFCYKTVLAYLDSFSTYSNFAEC